MKEGNNRKSERESERKRASERMRRERASYAKIVFLQFNFEWGEKKRRKDTKRNVGRV